MVNENFLNLRGGGGGGDWSPLLAIQKWLKAPHPHFSRWWGLYIENVHLKKIYQFAESCY